MTSKQIDPQKFMRVVLSHVWSKKGSDMTFDNWLKNADVFKDPPKKRGNYQEKIEEWWASFTEKDNWHKWCETYPSDIIRQELAQAKLWLLNNPKKQKTNFNKFFQNWLQRWRQNHQEPGTSYKEI